jgi:hypothetical protein
MRGMSVALLAACLLVAGCAADSTIVQRALVLESGYDPLTCPEIVTRHKAADARVKELTALMEKSGNAFANALAYDTEYATARANLRFAERAAERKGCDLGNKPPPAPATTLAAPAPATPLELAPSGAAPAPPKK